MDYAQIKSVNFSTLKHMATSPLAYQYALHTPLDGDMPALRIGRAYHVLALDGVTAFDSAYVTYPGKQRRGKEWEAFLEQHADYEILSTAEFALVHDMVRALHEHEHAHELISTVDRHTEIPLQWTDKHTGLPCKGRMDLVVQPGCKAAELAPGGEPVEVWDLKSTQTVKERRLVSEMADRLYHCQLAFYRRGLVANGFRVGRCGLICQEKAGPWDVFVMQYDAGALFAADLVLDKLLERLSACLASDKWPGASPGTQKRGLPTWAVPEEALQLVVAHDD